MGRKKKIVLKAEAAARAAGKTVKEIVAENPEEFPPSILEKPSKPLTVEFEPQAQEPEAKKEEQLFIQPEAVDGLFDIFGKILAAAAVRFKNVPADIAAEAFPFTQSDKDTLRKPVAKVINKHAPAWLIKYQDEIAVTLMVTTVINAKIQLCNALIASRVRESAQAPTEIVQ
jgi:hypothetical protein